MQNSHIIETLETSESRVVKPRPCLLMPRRKLATGNSQIHFTYAPCGVRSICPDDSGISTQGCVRHPSRQCSTGAASARPLPSDLIVAGKYFNLGTRCNPRRCIARTAHAYGALAYAKGSGNGLSYCCRSAARIEVERVLQMAMAVLRQTLFALPHDVTNNLH